MNTERSSFGYLPDPDDFDTVLKSGSFTRALVAGAPVREVVRKVRECRVIQDPDALGVELPDGVYWFQGVDDGPIILNLDLGSLPMDAVVVSLDDLDNDHPLANAWQHAEVLWGKAAPVPVPLFELNQPAVTHPGGVDVVVRDRKFFVEQWSYTVTIEGRQQDISESRLRPIPEVDDPSTWVTTEPTPAARFGATLTRAKLLGKFSNTLFSFRATRTTFRPYQFKPVLKLLQTGKARLLIADEVGLGKTIEAGLIWTELEARQEADRVLVVCPSSLLGKWKKEMEERFGFELTELNRSALDEFVEKYRQNRLPARQAYISSLETLRIWKGLDELREFPPEFGLIIIDEAHSMRNLDTKSYALGAELSDWAANLVFLTATPINLSQQNLLNLLELLAPEDYGDARDLELRLQPNAITNAVAGELMKPGVSGLAVSKQLEGLSTSRLGQAVMQRPAFSQLTDLLIQDKLTHRDIVQAKRYLADLNTLSTVITRTKKVEVDDRKAKRQEDRREISWTAAEDAFYSEYLTWCVNRAKHMGSSLYFAMQMPLRLASACLPMARLSVLNPEAFGEIKDADSDSSDGSAASRERLEPHPELIEAARALGEDVDTKFDRLSEVLRELHAQGRQALLFTFSRPTLSYLRDRLEADFRVAVLHGGVSREQRQKIMAAFRGGAYDFVLANRVASEGLDFEFCSAVINYDLPWNPMEIEQRIGRIDRIGQREETILVINFINEATIDERILARLLDRIDIFESSIGKLEPIISASAPEILRKGFDFTLTPEQRDQKVHEALTALEEQRRGMQDVSDASRALLVSNDVDVAGLEEDLLRTGRYVGQRELALLLDDWARVAGAPGARFGSDGRTVELHGNAAMATRVDELATSNRRTRAETSPLSVKLRDEMPISLILDQEFARTSGGTLLTATSPLTMAAAEIPGHRQARFASLCLTARASDLKAGTYVVVLARATGASQGGDEIWGAAVTSQGRAAGEAPVDALLRALAEGTLADAPLPAIDRLPKLAEQAMNRLSTRHQVEQANRDSEFHALQESRRVTLEEQHKRKMDAIEIRIQTAHSRGREERAITLFRSQQRRAEERFAAVISGLANAAPPDVRLESLAACVIDVVPAQGDAK